MSKGLEALHRIANANNHFKYDTLELMDKDFQIVQQELKRLEAIDNSNPNEALRCLDSLDDMFYLVKRRTTENGNHEEYEFYPCETKEYDIIEQALIKSQEQEKIFKIIKEKQVNFSLLMISDNVEDYNFYIPNIPCVEHKRCLTEEEFNLLKRYFG